MTIGAVRDIDRPTVDELGLDELFDPDVAYDAATADERRVGFGDEDYDRG